MKNERTLIEKTVNFPGLVTEVNNKIKKRKKKKERKEDTKAVKIMKILLLIVVIGSICMLWARFISTKGLRVKEIRIESPKLPDEYDGLKIVQFTDLHYGSTIFNKELSSIVKEINKQKPDIIIFTGDLVEAGVKLNDDEINKLVDELNKLKATTEMYAVKGNHDYDHDYFDKIMPLTNFKLLNNTYDEFYKDSTIPIMFVGFDDLLEGTPDYKNGFSYLNDLAEERFTIILQHEPDQVLEYKEDYSNYDIIFAGHSHHGQVRLPLIGALWTPAGSKKYYDEHYKIDGKDMYISGGIGTSTMRLRFFNKPSITLYRFYAE